MYTFFYNFIKKFIYGIKDGGSNNNKLSTLYIQAMFANKRLEWSYLNVFWIFIFVLFCAKAHHKCHEKTQGQ